MSSNSFCPVPKEQRPIEEFHELSNSWFFGLPVINKTVLYKALSISWLSITPLSMLISSGSWTLRHNPTKLILLSLVISLFLPCLLLLRQWLSWNYIFKRLSSENIEYEETGWYDGQTWEKPLQMRQRELLIAQYEVQPILCIISNSLYINSALLIAGLFLINLI